MTIAIFWRNGDIQFVASLLTFHCLFEPRDHVLMTLKIRNRVVTGGRLNLLAVFVFECVVQLDNGVFADVHVLGAFCGIRTGCN